VNIVQILHTHICKWKNDIIWNYSRNRGRQKKESGRGGDFKYNTFDIMWNLLEMLQSSSTQHNNKKRK
jgi:hypothetical protein